MPPNETLNSNLLLVTPTEHYRLLQRLVRAELARQARSRNYAATIQSGYVSGNPTLQLANETSSTSGSKTHKVLQPISNRNGKLAASNMVQVAADDDENRTPLGKIVDASSVVVDADYLMGVRPVEAGNTLLVSANTERSAAVATYTEKKRFALTRPGRYRVSFDLSRTGGVSAARLFLRLPDGTEIEASAEATYSSTVYPTFGSFSLDMNQTIGWGGILIVKIKNDSAPAQTAYIRNVQVKYQDATAIMPVYDAVITD